MGTSHFSVERRVAERFRVSLPVETERGPGVSRDVSVSGLYLVIDQRLAAGDRLRLTVALPDKGCALPLRLDLRGRVVRVEDVNGATGAGIALDDESARLLPAS